MVPEESDAQEDPEAQEDLESTGAPEAVVVIPGDPVGTGTWGVSVYLVQIEASETLGREDRKCYNTHPQDMGISSIRHIRSRRNRKMV